MAERVMIPAIKWAGGLMVPLRRSGDEPTPWHMADEEGTVYFNADHVRSWAESCEGDPEVREHEPDLAEAYRLLGDLIDELERD